MPNPGLTNRKIVEMDRILASYEGLIAEGMGKMEAYRTIGAAFDRDPQHIAAIVRSLTSTTAIATHLLKARAFRLASRLVREASPEQIIDILERPNIGVLAPKAEAASGGGFFLSVSADSCGAVKIGAGQTSGLRGLERPPALPPARAETQDDRAQRVSDLEGERTDGESDRNRESGGGGWPHGPRQSDGEAEHRGEEFAHPYLRGRDPEAQVVQEAHVNAQVPPVRVGGFTVRRASTLRAIEEARARIASGQCADQRRKHPGPEAPFTKTNQTPEFAKLHENATQKEARRLDLKRRRARQAAAKKV